MTPDKRAILEAAARACGIDGEYKTLHYFDGEETGICSVNHPTWNPLTNALDTAEMCAELEITCLWVSREKRVTCSAFSKQVSNVKALFKDHDNSRLKAWMYAATMVAAKIGGYEMTTLQPIETAPKDGSKILLAGNSGFADGYWLQSAYGGAGAWIWPYVYRTPRYWMPLPEVPK